MIKYIYILILSFLSITSCNLGKGIAVKHIVNNNLFGNDSVKVTDNSTQGDSIMINYNDVVNANHTEYYSLLVGDAYDFSHSSPQRIKIVEVKNTKVIKQSANLSEGRIVYKIPDVMKIRSTYKVLVRISKSKNVVSIYDSLQGTVMASTIPVTETMEVKLLDISPADNKSFEIVDGNSGVQMVEEGDTYTEWSWNVTPVRVGNSRLKIVVSVIRDNNKKDIVYEDSVDVQKDVFVQIGFFFKKYWQVFMTAVLIPFIVFLYKRIKEKKKENKEV